MPSTKRKNTSSACPLCLERVENALRIQRSLLETIEEVESVIDTEVTKKSRVKILKTISYLGKEKLSLNTARVFVEIEGFKGFRCLGHCGFSGKYGLTEIVGGLVIPKRKKIKV